MALLLIGSCGGGGAAQTESGSPADGSGSKLNLTLRSAEQAPGTLSVELLAENAAGLYQLSSRLSFNPAAVRPSGPARPGNLISANAIFYSNDRQESFVPVAFTNRSAAAISQASGQIFIIEFDVTDPAADPAFNLVRDSEFLIARDNAARDIELQLEVQQ